MSSPYSCIHRIQGLDYVYQAAQYSGRRSIANLSLGFPDPDRKIISIDTMVGEVSATLRILVALPESHRSLSASKRVYTFVLPQAMTT